MVIPREAIAANNCDRKYKLIFSLKYNKKEDVVCATPSHQNESDFAMTQISIHYTGDIVTKKEAIELSLTRYFTGNPCLNGHISQRYLRGQCCVCSSDYTKFYHKKWYNDNKEALKKKSTDWYKNNRDLRRVTSKEYRIKNKDTIKERKKQYRQENKQKIRANIHNRKAKKRGNGGIHTGQQAIDLFNMQGGKCVYCKIKLTENNKHKDHIIPLALGGTNNIENIQWLCAKCNLSKGAKHPAIYALEIGMLL